MFLSVFTVENNKIRWINKCMMSYTGVFVVAGEMAQV